MIPLSIPNIIGNELKYVTKCIETGWISSAGQYVNIFENQISKYTETLNAIACMNGTVGLQTALNVLGVSNTELVLTTNLTFVATLNAISYTGAEPILFDIDSKTWQIDLELVEKWLSTNTHIREINGEQRSYHNISQKKIGAILPVHILGGITDIDKL